MRLSYVILLISFSAFFRGASSQDAKWGEFGEWVRCKENSHNKEQMERRIQLCQLDGKTVSPIQCSGPPKAESRPCRAGIVHGVKAGKFPSQAFIELDNGDNQCGGSYIGGQWILTAAHCFDNDQKATRISLGSNNRYAQSGQNMTAEKTCCHKDYNSAKLEHDICLVKMTHRPFPSAAIDLIKMTTDTSYPDEGTECRVVGWGYDEFRNLPDELLEANVSVVDKATCDTSYKSLGNPLPTNTICAGHLEGGADTCGGDSGGPLFCKHNGEWTLSGVTSQGHFECGIKDFPGVYTKIADYVPWVEETMKTSCENTVGFHWGDWIRACSVTCGEGIEASFRPCLDAKDMPAANENCDGESNSVGKCDRGSCDGYHWGEWTKTCSVTCGEGIEEMVRECLDAENKKTAVTNCDGSPNTLGKCNPGVCPEYHWGEWIKACSVTCGEGVEASFRPCLNANDMPAPEENCDGESRSTGTCNPGSCREYRWSEWTRLCSVTCGEGEEESLRICLDDEDNTVDPTNCDGESRSVGKCSLDACEVFQWGPWKRVCSVTCGEGTSDMTRVCLDSRGNEVDAENCDGDAISQEKCSLPSCEEKRTADASFCFLLEATFDSLDQFQNSFNSLQSDLQTNLKFIKEYTSSDIASEYRSVSGKVEGVAIINVEVELDSEGDTARVKNLVNIYIRALARGSGFDAPPTECGVDPCFSEPCRNDGVCQPMPGSSTLYQCQCKQGYTGQNCETEEVIDPCTSEPCQNDGVCEAVPGSSTFYQCRCKQGYRGANCETVIDPCTSEPCQNDGVCTRLSASRYRCRCKSGFLGRNCGRERVNPCSSDPCQNGGRCTRLSSTRYRCRCTQGYSGTNCETEIFIDPCSSRPCQNGGTCTRLSASSYQCQCRQGFSGNQCQTEITTVVEEFCFEVTSRDGLGAQFFSSVFNSFRDDLSENLRSFSGFRGISSQGSSTDGSLDVTVRIQATTDNGRTKQGVENDLSRIIETSSLRTGLGGKPATCGKVPDTKPEGEKYCVQIRTTNVAGNDIKLVNIRTDLQSSLKTFPGFEKVDFDTTLDTGSIKMTVTVSTSNTPGGSNWSRYLQYLVQRSAQTNGITDNPTSCSETPTPRNPCLPNPCQNEGTCFPQGAADYYCRCRPQYSGKNCETARVVTRTQDFCFEVRSVTPNARNLFSAFGSQIQSQLATFNGYRGVELGAQTRGFPGGEEIIITTRIQAVPTAGKTSADVNTSLMQLVQTSARNSGIFGSVTNCNAA